MRRSRLPAAAAALLAVVVAAAAGDGCVPGLYLIVARGSTEPAGSGLVGTLAKRVAHQVNDSRVVPLDYPATFTNPLYNESEYDGVRAMHNTVEQYVKACPDSKLAVMGYSQGAQVTLDAFCGAADDADVTPPQALPASLVQGNVVAMVLFGDPSHTNNATYNRGTSVQKGIFKRDPSSLRVCEGYADRLVSYCDKGDIYCDGGDDRPVHATYAPKYGDQAVQYVVDRYNDFVDNAAAASSSSSSSGGGGSVTATAGPTTASMVSASPSSSAPSGGAGATSGTGGASASAVSLALPLAAAAVALLHPML